MKFVDRSIYLPDVRIIEPQKEVMQLFDSGSYKDYHDSYLEHSFEDACEIAVTFFKEFPEALFQDNVFHHVKRCYNYAKRKEYDVASCYHYSGYDSDKEEDVKSKMGVNITRIAPYCASEFVLDIMIEKYYFNKLGFQTKITAIYDYTWPALSLQDCSVMDIEDKAICQFNFNPEKVKLMQIRL